MGIYISAFFLGVILPVGIQKIFIHYKRFDDINHRSSHNTLATRTGGIGVFLILFFISCYHYVLGIELFNYSLLIPLGIMFIIGVYDDLYNADFKLKFFLQIIVAKILIDQGYVIENYHGLFGLNEIPWILAQLSTVFVFLIIVNSINFIDGIDGLAITEVIKIFILIFFLSTKQNPFEVIIGIICFSLIPLYYFNFKNKGKVFLGDGGSLFLGTMVAISVFYVLGQEYQLREGVFFNKTIFSVLLCIFPLVDLLRVFIIRIKNKKSPFEADKNHIHHWVNRKLNHSLLTILIIQFTSVVPITLYLLFTTIF